jgi:hypothetical protein
MIVPYPYPFYNSSVFWLGVESGSPTIFNVKSVYFANHDSLPKVMLFLIIWVLMIVLQLFSFAFGVFWCFMTAPVAIVWLLIGFVLFQSKLIAVRQVWNLWIGVWTGSSELQKSDEEPAIDAAVINESILLEFVVESLPQAAIQSYNNTLIGSWTTFSYVSSALSVAMILNGIYRYLYYILWMQKTFDEIPTFEPFSSKKMKISKSSTTAPTSPSGARGDTSGFELVDVYDDRDKQEGDLTCINK